MAVSFVAASSAASNTAGMPTHAIGDLILAFAYNNASATLPTKPTAAGNVPAFVDLDANAGADSNALRVCYFVATSSTHTVGTWTNATGMGMIVLRGQAGSPFGGHAEAGSAASNLAVAPPVSLSHNDATSILVHFVGHTSVTVWPTIAGYTRRANTATRCALYTKDSTNSDGALNAAATTSSNSGYRGATVEVLDPAGTFLTPAVVAFFAMF